MTALERIDVEAGGIRAEQEPNFISVKTLGRIFYWVTGTTAVSNAAVSIFSGVVSIGKSSPYGYYVVSGVTGAFALSQIALFILTGFLVPKKEYEQDVAQMQAELSKFQGEISTLKADNDALLKTKSQYEQAKQGLDEQIKAAHTSIEEQKAAIKSLGEKLQTSNDANKAALDELEKLYKQTKETSLQLGSIIIAMTRQNAELLKGNAKLNETAGRLKDAAQKGEKFAEKLKGVVTDIAAENKEFRIYLEAMQEVVRANEEYMAQVKAEWDTVIKQLKLEDDKLVQLQQSKEATLKETERQIAEIKRLITDLAENAPAFKPLIEKMKKYEKEHAESKKSV